MGDGIKDLAQKARDAVTFNVHPDYATWTPIADAFDALDHAAAATEARIRSQVEREIAAWLREHGEDDAFARDVCMNDGGNWEQPDPDKLADAIESGAYRERREP